MTGTERRMPGEGQLALRREDAHAVVRSGIGRRQQEGGFREVRPARQRGHTRFAQTFGGVDHRERISAERVLREDVDLREPERRHIALTV